MCSKTRCMMGNYWTDGLWGGWNGTARCHFLTRLFVWFRVMPIKMISRFFPCPTASTAPEKGAPSLMEVHFVVLPIFRYLFVCFLMNRFMLCRLPCLYESTDFCCLFVCLFVVVVVVVLISLWSFFLTGLLCMVSDVLHSSSLRSLCGCLGHVRESNGLRNEESERGGGERARESGHVKGMQMSCRLPPFFFFVFSLFMTHTALSVSSGLCPSPPLYVTATPRHLHLSVPTLSLYLHSVSHVLFFSISFSFSSSFFFFFHQLKWSSDCQWSSCQ